MKLVVFGATEKLGAHLLRANTRHTTVCCKLACLVGRPGEIVSNLTSATEYDATDFHGE